MCGKGYVLITGALFAVKNFMSKKRHNLFKDTLMVINLFVSVSPLTVNNLTKSEVSIFTLAQTRPVFTCLQYKYFENTVGKVENARNEQFLLFQECCLILLENFLPFSSNLKLSSANSFSLGESRTFVVWESKNRDIKMS